MSTAPSEAHIDLAVTIYKKRESFPPFDKVKEAAQLIADSEARAVEAANTEIAELKKCIEELYQQAHETVQFSDSNEMSMDMEISAAFGILASHRDEAQDALTAERERVRVLTKHGIGALMVARSWQMVWGDKLSPDSVAIFTKHEQAFLAAFAPNSEHAKEGSV